MAITSVFESNLTKPKSEKPLSFLEKPEQGGLFSNIKTGESTTGDLVGQNVESMLTGDAYDAYRSKRNQDMARSIQNLKQSVGNQYGRNVGQGTYDRAQQRAQQGIFSELASQNLAAEVEKQQMKERGIKTAQDLATAERDTRLQNLQTGMQADTLYGYTDQFGNRVRGSNVLAGVQADVAKQQAETAEKLGFAQLASGEKVAFADLGLDAQKLAESARQFNVTTEQASKQFTDKLNFDYDSLSLQDKQFLTSLGFDREKFNQSKVEFDKTIALQDKIQTRDLDVKEQALAQEAEQFTNRLEFDQWATEAGLEDTAAARIWQAKENSKALDANLQIQSMLNNTERWKQGRVETLTREGWDRETVEKSLDREQQETLFHLNSALTRELEDGRITQQEADRAQNASQFTSKLEWEKEAQRLGMTEAEAKRAWATSERIGAEAFSKTENSLERQTQKEIASGQWLDDQGNPIQNIEAQKLVESVRQFNEQAEWIKESKKMDISEAQAQRAWATNERIEDNVFKGNLQELQNQLVEKGITQQYVMGFLQDIGADQAADVLQSMALEAGMTYIDRDADGKVLYDSETDLPKTRKGFPPSSSNSTQKAYDIRSQLESGELDINEYRDADKQDNENYENYKAILDVTDEWSPKWQTTESDGFFQKGSVKRTMSNKLENGTIIRINNRLYQTETWKDNGNDKLRITDLANKKTWTIE